MIFYFLISIVFVAEVIIAMALIISLIKIDRIFVEYNEFIQEAKPLIKDMMQTIKNMSEQFLELAPKLVTQIKAVITDLIMGQVKSSLGALTFWLVKKEVEKHV